MPETEHSELYDLKTFLILLATVFMATSCYGQVYPDHIVDSTLKAGINRIINQDYTGAEKTFISLDRRFPRLPLGKIYLAAVRIARAYDYGEEYNESLIDSLLNLAEDQSRKLVNENNDIWNNYFLSLAEGYTAYFKALNGDWLNSLSEGVNALRDFEDLILRDKDFYEAYIAIGTFKYWKSKKTEFLNWIPGYADESAEGIDLLEKAINQSAYNTYLAVNSLIWIYIDQGEFSKAAGLAENALKQYPGSRFFKWSLARAYEESDVEKSIQIYREILNSYPAALNHYNEIILKHLIAQQYARTGEYQKAVKLCDEILSIKYLDKNTLSKLENRLKRVEELKRELSR